MFSKPCILKDCLIPTNFIFKRNFDLRAIKGSFGRNFILCQKLLLRLNFKLHSSAEAEGTKFDLRSNTASAVTLIGRSVLTLVFTFFLKNSFGRTFCALSSTIPESSTQIGSDILEFTYHTQLHSPSPWNPNRSLRL